MDETRPVALRRRKLRGVAAIASGSGKEAVSGAVALRGDEGRRQL
jgi:hypothetical protein